MQKKKQKQNKTDTDLIPFTEINSKWITDLNVKRKTINSQKIKLGTNLDDLGYAGDFLDTTPMAQPMK